MIYSITALQGYVFDFEIYYTTLPNANKMSINDTGIYNSRCRLPYADEEADVYICAVSPDEIEYAISKGEELGDDVEVIRKKVGVLRELFIFTNF